MIAAARTQSAATVHVQAARTAAAATSDVEEGDEQAGTSTRQHATSELLQLHVTSKKQMMCALQ
jgi:hypothetical protein